MIITRRSYFSVGSALIHEIQIAENSRRPAENEILTPTASEVPQCFVSTGGPAHVHEIPLA